MAKYTKPYTQKYINTIGDEITLHPETTMAQVIGLSDTLAAVEVTLTAANWSASAPYTQTVIVEGMTKNWKAGAHTLVSSGNIDADITAQINEGYLTWIDTGDGYMVFTCGKHKPEVDFTLEIPGVLKEVAADG